MFAAGWHARACSKGPSLGLIGSAGYVAKLYLELEIVSGGLSIRPMIFKTTFALLVVTFARFCLRLGTAPLGVHALAVDKQDLGGQTPFGYGDVNGLKGDLVGDGVTQRTLHGRFLHITDIVCVLPDPHEENGN